MTDRSKSQKLFTLLKMYVDVHGILLSHESFLLKNFILLNNISPG